MDTTEQQQQQKERAARKIQCIEALMEALGDFLKFDYALVIEDCDYSLSQQIANAPEDLARAVQERDACLSQIEALEQYLAKETIPRAQYDAARTAMDMKLKDIEEHIDDLQKFIGI